MSQELSALIPLVFFTSLLRTPASVAVSPKARKLQSFRPRVVSPVEYWRLPIALHCVPKAALLENTHSSLPPGSPKSSFKTPRLALLEDPPHVKSYFPCGILSSVSQPCQAVSCLSSKQEATPLSVGYELLTQSTTRSLY